VKFESFQITMENYFPGSPILSSFFLIIFCDLRFPQEFYRLAAQYLILVEGESGMPNA